MTTPTNEAGFVACDFVYTGRRAMKGNKPGAEVFRIENGRLRNGYIFTIMSLKGKVIGGVYRGAQFSDTHALGIGTATFVERWSGQSDCIVWRARDEAFDANQRLLKLEADAKKVNEIESMLLPLRKLHASYSRQYDHAGKEALEQAVLRALRSAPRRSESE